MEDSPLDGLPDQSNLVHLLWESAVPGPSFARLAGGIRGAIGSGRLQAGDALPPSRALATELGVSRWVVVEAYEQLKAEGYLVADRGSATRVADVPLPATEAAADADRAQPDPVVPRIEPAPALPDLAGFPRRAWKLAHDRALGSMAHSELGYPPAQGVYELRDAVAGYLRRVRGMPVSASDVQITQGTSVGLPLLLRLLSASGRRDIALEDPCWPRAYEAATDHGMRVHPVPVDELGVRADALAATTASSVYVTPSHQFPTGAVLDPARRAGLLTWATTGDRLIIEDDYDAELRYDRRPVGPLAALAPQHVAYLGSASKSLAPAVRIGWMVLPVALRDDAARLTERLRAVPSSIDQHTVANLITSGAYDRHLRKIKRTYPVKRRALVDALLAAMPAARITEHPAGLHIALALPPHLHESDVIDHARRRGVVLTGIGTCRLTDGGAQQAVLIGFGNLAARDVALVVEALAEIMG